MGKYGGDGTVSPTFFSEPFHTTASHGTAEAENNETPWECGHR